MFSLWQMNMNAAMTRAQPVMGTEFVATQTLPGKTVAEGEFVEVLSGLQGGETIGWGGVS